MKARIKAIAAAGIVVVSIGGMSQMAGATSVSKIQSISQSISDDLQAGADATDDYDFDALESACSDLGFDTSVAMSYSRPRGVPKAAWRHSMNGWRLLNESAEHCEVGARDIDVDEIEMATDLMGQARDEISLATALLP